MQFLSAGCGTRAYGWGPLRRIEDGTVSRIGVEEFSGPNGERAQDVWVEPGDDAQLIVLRYGDGAVLESTDAGETWTQLTACP